MDYRKLTLTKTQKVYFYVAMFTIGFVIGWIFYDNLSYGMVIGLILLTLEGEYRRYLLEKRKKELLLQFRDLLYSLSSSVATGRSIRQALIESYTFWQGTYKEDDYIMQELKIFIDKMEKSNVEDIYLIEDFGIRTGLEDIKDMAMTCRVCKKTGGNLSMSLSKCSDIISDKISLEMELHTIMVQKRFEGYIIATAPLVLMLMMKLLTPSYLEPLTSSNTGHMLSTISLALIAAAWLIIERVNRIEI